MGFYEPRKLSVAKMDSVHQKLPKMAYLKIFINCSSGGFFQKLLHVFSKLMSLSEKKIHSAAASLVIL